MSDLPLPEQYVAAASKLGDKVRALREDRGMTQEQLAERAHISRNQVQNIEHSRNNAKRQRGRTGPGNARFETIYYLAAALQVDISYLVDPERDVEPVPARPAAV